MLLKYAQLSLKPRIFRKLTGMKLKDFHKLCDRLKKAYEKKFNHLGRRSKLPSLKDKLTLLLIYYRTYVTHEFLGYFVDLNNSNISRIFKKLEPIVAKKINIKKDRTLTEEKVERLLIDVTEQPTQRPKSTNARKKYYSGKKKRHTLKTEIAIQPNGKIMHVSKMYPGKTHDFNIRKTSKPFHKEAEKYVDLGYLGIKKIQSNVFLPFKKTKSQKLTQEQKNYNKEISKIRVPVENKFAELKKFRILGEVYRNFRKKHNLRFNLIAGIVNLQNGF